MVFTSLQKMVIFFKTAERRDCEAGKVVFTIPYQIGSEVGVAIESCGDEAGFVCAEFLVQHVDGSGDGAA